MQVDKPVTIVGRLSAGSYFLGDPFCQIRAPNWVAFGNAYEHAAKEKDCQAVIFKFRGRKCFASKVHQDRNSYFDQYGNNYDSGPWGLISVIPVKISDEQCGAPVDFPQSFSVGADAACEYIRIGSRIIRR